MEATDRLRANIDRLGARDQEFATSLLGSRGLSSKQLYWIGVLADRATQPEVPAERLDNVQAIVALMQQGKASGLKRPAIVFEAGDMKLRLSIAGERSSVPGSVNVTSAGPGGFEGREWYGRIHLDGKYSPSRNATQDAQTAILAALRAFAADPAKVAAEYGRKHGYCCFCSRELTDPKSIELGMGPVCAGRFGVSRG